MSVTITVQELANDMRIGPLDAETQSVLERELAAATILIERKAPNAPDATPRPRVHSALQRSGLTAVECRTRSNFQAAWDTIAAIHSNAARRDCER